MYRKPTFFTADWHLGHEKSIVFDKAPFDTIEEKHAALVKNYNTDVPDDGICYFLGDVGLCNQETMLPIISQLKGTKVLILGNHDKHIASMYNLGFDVVLYGATLYIAGERVTMTHCPLRGVPREDTAGMLNTDGTENWHGEKRQLKFSTENSGQFHLHGHIHTHPKKTRSKKIDGKQYDVGAPGNNYRPVHIGQIESWIDRYKKGKV